MTQRLSGNEANERAPQGWRVLADRLETSYTCIDMTAAGRLVARICALADERDHHPDLAVRHPGVVRVSTTSHDTGGLTARDLRLAAAIEQLAQEEGARAEAGAPQRTEIGIDALDIEAVRPFWAAVLDYREQPDGSLADPRGAGADVWFQQMDAPRPQRNRVHLDVWVPHDVVEQRTRAALDAGGRLLTDEHAPSFWVLADREGNEVCLCTWQDRR